MTSNSPKQKQLPNPSPSSPARPPKYHLYFTIKHNGEDTSFFTQAWTQLYAVANIVQRITNALGEPRWLNSSTISYQKDDYQLIIKEHHLEDIIEHPLTETEKAWTPHHPYSSQINRALTFSETAPIAPTPEPDEKPKVQPRRHKKTKPSPDGQTTIPVLAEEYNIQPNKARQILRKNNISKPPTGWTFDNKDPILKTIRQLFQQHS